jgi:hypothetical protein
MIMLTAVEIIGQTLTTDVWTSYDDPMSELTFYVYMYMYVYMYVYCIHTCIIQAFVKFDGLTIRGRGRTLLSVHT